MKLKVGFCNKKEWIESDTIDTLKDSIMSRFYMTAGELSRRLLVRDNRDLNGYPPIITGCFDLLELKDDGSTTLNDCCEDGDTLVLGWKGPCIVRLVPDFFFEDEGHNIEFDNSFTLGQFKQKIHELTRKPATKKNLPEVLFEGDDERPLLYFGFYRIRPVHSKDDCDFKIFPDSNNRPVSKYPVLSVVKWDDKGNEFLSHSTGITRAKSAAELDEFMASMKRKIQLQSMKNIEDRKKWEKMMMNKKKNNDNNNNNNNSNKEAKLLTDLS